MSFLAGCNCLLTYHISLDDIASVSMTMRMRSVGGSEIVYLTENEQLSLLLLLEFDYEEYYNLSAVLC